MSAHILTFHALVAVLAIAVYAISSRTLRLRRHPSAAIAWFISLLLMPYLTLPLYLIFGIRKINLKPITNKTANLPLSDISADTLVERTQQLAAIMTLPPACAYYQMNLHQNGEESLAALRDMIGKAQHSIDICTFILARDELGKDIVQRLHQRIREGVRVRLLLDGVGAYLGHRYEIKSLSAAGIEVALFVPLLRSPLRGRTNLRNHRKLLIVDQNWVWSGGRNLAAEYFTGKPLQAPTTHAWLDLSLDLRGPLAEQVHALFEQDWHFARHSALATRPALAQALPTAELRGGQLIASGPDQNDDTLYTLLISGFFTARHRILLVTPYFIPNPTLLMSLTLAARRGVKVDLVLPDRSNHRLADIVRHQSLRELATAGARVWLLPRMIHAKAIVIDDELAFIGTANLDERSLFLNYELMLAIYDKPDVARIAHWIDARRKDASAYRSSPAGFWRGTGEGLLLWLAFQL